MNLYQYDELLIKMELRERILLGFLMMDAEAPNHVIVKEKIDRRCFHFAETRAVFVNIEEMFNQGLPIGPLEVYEYMLANGSIREINGISSINDFIACMQYITFGAEDYTLDYLLNLIQAQTESREMMFLITRYDFSEIEGDDIEPIH